MSVKKRSRRRIAAGRARRRPPTTRQVEGWKAVQAAKAKGLNITDIALAPGILRHRVRKYVKATAPPRNRTRRKGAINKHAGDVIRQELREPVH